MYTIDELRLIDLALQGEIRTITEDWKEDKHLAEWIEDHEGLVEYVALRKKTKQLIRSEEDKRSDGSRIIQF